MPRITEYNYYLDRSEIDAGILTRISEDDIKMWLAARLLKMRESGIEFNAISFFSIMQKYPSSEVLLGLYVDANSHCKSSAKISGAVAALIHELHAQNSDAEMKKRATKKKLLAAAKKHLLADPELV